MGALESGLNPFSFRAGVLLPTAEEIEYRAESQSLFIQGWGTTCQQPIVRRTACVSIPFHSGLGYYVKHAELNQTLRLNPFSFRAGVLRHKRLHPGNSKLSQSLFIQGWGTTPRNDENELRKRVSIPFHSGLGYYFVPCWKMARNNQSQSLFIQGWGTTVS